MIIKKYSYMIVISILLILLLLIGGTYLLQKIDEPVKNSLIKLKKDYLFIINKQKEFVSEQEKMIQFLNTELKRKQVVTVSFYHPNSRGINSDTDPTNTAIMVAPIVGRTVAISTELFEAGWLGQKIYIDGFGIFVCEDRMSSKIKGKQIDICVASRKEAFQRGKKYNIIATRLM